MSVSPNPEPAPAPGLFPATAWTLVARAVDGADGVQQAALNELLQRYWRPIYIYLRRSGKPEAAAEDLTQGFFAHLLEKNLLERVHLRQVRFRGYLRGVLEHYLANESRRNGALKRKGAVSLDVAGAESWLATAPTDSAESAFDRIWAVECLDRAFAKLRQELSHSGRVWVVDALLKRFGLGNDAAAVSVAQLSKEQGVSENQFSVALHRARQRLRELILAEVRDGMSTPEEAAEEVQALFAALATRKA